MHVLTNDFTKFSLNVLKTKKNEILDVFEIRRIVSLLLCVFMLFSYGVRGVGMNRSPGPNWLRVQIEMCDVIQLSNDIGV